MFCFVFFEHESEIFVGRRRSVSVGEKIEEKLQAKQNSKKGERNRKRKNNLFNFLGLRDTTRNIGSSV